MNVSGFLPFCKRCFFSLKKVPGYLFFSVLLLALSAAAFIEFYVSGLARKTFVFYDFDSGVISVEDRMMPVSDKNPSSREIDITRYVEEAVLGPIYPNSLPLFPGETRLVSLLYRNGTVYADFSEEAALPPAAGGEVLKNLKTLDSGIKRNFTFVNEVRFFIAGKTAFGGEF